MAAGLHPDSASGEAHAPVVETETLGPRPASVLAAANASHSLIEACVRCVDLFWEQTVGKFPLVNFLTPRIILALEMSFPHPPYFTLTVQKYTNTRTRIPPYCQLKCGLGHTYYDICGNDISNAKIILVVRKFTNGNFPTVCSQNKSTQRTHASMRE